MAQKTCNGSFEGSAEVSKGLNQITSCRPWATTGMTGTEVVDGENAIAHAVFPASTGKDPSWLLGTGSILSDASVDMRRNRVERDIDDLQESDLKNWYEATHAPLYRYQQHIPAGSDAYNSMRGILAQSFVSATSRSDTPSSSIACNDIFSIPSEAYEQSDCSSTSVGGSREPYECDSEPLQDISETCEPTSRDNGGVPHSNTEPGTIEYADEITSKVPPSAERKKRTPLRLLYVRSALHGTELHLSEIHHSQPPVYLTFSHAWAQNVHIAATTRASLRKCDRNIPVTSLPDVIQDAVSITLSFGLSYLWIDALCEYKTRKDRSDHIYERWTILYEAYAMIISDVSGLTLAEGLPGIRIIEIRTPSHQERPGSDTIWRRWLKTPLKPWTSLSKVQTSTNTGIQWATLDADLGDTSAESHLFTRYGGKLFGITDPIATDFASRLLKQRTKVYPSNQVVSDASESKYWVLYWFCSLAFPEIALQRLSAKTSRPGIIHATQTPVSLAPGIGGGSPDYDGNWTVSNDGTGPGLNPESKSASPLRKAGSQLETTHPSAEPAVDIASTHASEHNGCKLKCPRLFGDERGPNCAQEVCFRHIYATVGDMKEVRYIAETPQMPTTDFLP